MSFVRNKLSTIITTIFIILIFVGIKIITLKIQEILKNSNSSNSTVSSNENSNSGSDIIEDFKNINIINVDVNDNDIDSVRIINFFDFI